MTIIQSVIYADFEDPRSLDCDLETLKPTKKGPFCLKRLLIFL